MVLSGAIVAQPASRRAVAALCLATFSFSFSQSLLYPALPAIQERYGVDASHVAWVVSGFLCVAAAITPIVGRLADIHGRGRLLLASLSLFGCGSVVSAIAPSFEVLLAGRVVSALGATIVALTVGLVRDHVPPERVAHSIGVVTGMTGLGGAAGLVVSGLLVDHGSLSLVFWSSVPVTLLGSLAVWRYVFEPPTRALAAIDWIGGLGLALTLVALLLTLNRGGSSEWTSWPAPAFLGAAVLLGSAWTRWELRTATALVDLRRLRTRAILGASVATFATGFGVFGAFVLIPLFVQSPESNGYGFGASAAASGLFLVPHCAVSVFAASLSGRVAAMRGPRLPLTVGSSTVLAGCVWLAVVHGDPADLYAGSAVMGLGAGLVFAATANVVVQATPPLDTAAATSVNSIMRLIGGAFGAQAAAAILSSGTAGSGAPSEQAFTIAFTVGGAAALVALAASFVVPAQPRRRCQAEPLGTPASGGV